MKFTPLKINALGSYLNNSGFSINPNAVLYMGSCSAPGNYTPGQTVSGTVLSPLVSVIRQAYEIRQAYVNSDFGMTPQLYANLISIGNGTIPALGDSKPSTYTHDYSGAVTSGGWLSTIPLQAHNELNVGSYNKFTATFMACYSRMNQWNAPIIAATNSVEFLDGIYSNMNDLITADITGVSLSTFYWGQDLIASGKVIDLLSIATFGQPINLLRTLSKARAITQALNLALLAANLNGPRLAELISGQEPTDEEQRFMYAAFCMIMEKDLQDVLVPLNCQTRGLTTLADLLYVKKLFPNSYSTLTVPVFNATPMPTNSKTYHFIFTGDNPNILDGYGYGEKLRNIVPFEVAYTSEVFSASMQQIKNLSTMTIERFSQVVMNLENVSDLDMVAGTTKPTNEALAKTIVSTLGKGTSANGLYNMCDFFGAMTNLHYPWGELTTLINDTSTYSLQQIYNQMLTFMNEQGILLQRYREWQQLPEPKPPYTLPLPDYARLQTFINSANLEITSIYDNSPKASALNALYNSFGTLLSKEKDARTLALGNIADFVADDTSSTSFIQMLDTYSQNTEIKGAAPVLESISDKTTVGGNSTIAAMRECRNEKRIGLTGGELDNNVNGTAVQNPLYVADPIAVPNNADAINPVTGQRYPLTSTGAGPNGPGLTGTELTKPNGFMTINDPFIGFANDPGLQLIPIVTGAAIPGSMGDSEASGIIPDYLSVLISPNSQSVLSPSQAVEIVTHCNCDCWDNIM